MLLLYQIHVHRAYMYMYVQFHMQQCVHACIVTYLNQYPMSEEKEGSLGEDDA